MGGTQGAYASRYWFVGWMGDVACIDGCDA